MKKQNIILFLYLIFTISGCTSLNISEVDMREALKKTQANFAVDWVSIAEIKNSLQGQEPMNVGFDVDDTVFFSSASFFYGKNKYGAKYTKNQDFWNELNTEGFDVKFSIPKKVAKELVQMHIERGDTVYFITARTGPSNGAKETLSQALYNAFGTKNIEPVIFAGGNSYETEYRKTQFIKDANLSIYYGDADSDVGAGMEAGVRSIRILRSAATTYLPMPKAGKFGEEIVENSHF